MIWPFESKKRDARKAIDVKMDILKGMLKRPEDAQKAYMLCRNIAMWKRYLKELK